MTRFRLIIFVCGFLACLSANAATLNVVNGQLFGASELNIDGALFDVEFLDGSCSELFNGCNPSVDSGITDFQQATAAGEALLEQVFIDTGDGDFDSNPTLTNGCLGLTSCKVVVPFGASDQLFASATAINFSSLAELVGGVDSVESEITLGNNLFSTSADTETTFAVLTLITPAPVPLPASLYLFTAGLFCMKQRLRRRAVS